MVRPRSKLEDVRQRESLNNPLARATRDTNRGRSVSDPTCRACLTMCNGDCTQRVGGSGRAVQQMAPPPARLGQRVLLQAVFPVYSYSAYRAHVFAVSETPTATRTSRGIFVTFLMILAMWIARFSTVGLAAITSLRQR